MMAAILGRTRLIAVLAALLSIVGLVSWQTMPRQEDPSFAERFATLIVAYPGASPLDVERLVLEPLEDALQEVTDLREVRATARAGAGVFQLRLRDQVAPTGTDAAWDDVRRAVERAAGDLPAEALTLPLDTQVGDPATAVWLVSGSDDALVLREAARRLQDRLERVPGVERVTLVGDPGRQVSIDLPPDSANRLALSAPGLAAWIDARNNTVPGGSVLLDGRSVVVRHRGELRSVDAVRALPVGLPSGAAVPLGELARVWEQPELPRTTRVITPAGLAVGVAVIPVPDQDLIALGDRLQAALVEVTPSLEPLSVDAFAFQPAEVAARLGELSSSLVWGVLIVAGVLVLTMGPRLGLVVASVVPLVALSTVGIYAVGGGVLHQISIAALVLALGLLVDNAIVVAESVQQHLDAGHPQPAVEAVRELAVPLAAATGTTVAAFVPMLMSEGGTADFTRSIPLVVILALVLSLAFALLFTPMLAARFLRPSRAGRAWTEPFARRLAALAVRRPVGLLAALGVLVLGSGLLASTVPAEFFPMSDRARLMVTVSLPEGTHALETEALVADVVQALDADPDVASVTAFVGGGLPRFYYNLNDAPGSPHHAEIAVTAVDLAALEGLVARVDGLADRWPEATLIAKRLQQGPPVGAPVQIRLTGDDPVDLQDAAQAVTAALRTTPGAREVRHDLGIGAPALEVQPDDAWLGRLGLGRASLPVATLAQTLGAPAGRIRNGSDPLELVVRTPDAERTSMDGLRNAPVGTTIGPIPLEQLGEVLPVWGPAAIHHRDGRREVTVSAELAAGATFGSVLQAFRAPELPAGIELSFGGEAEGSEEANAAIVQTLPLGAGLLVFFLLLEFDSFRRLAIVLTTVPLAAVGVVPGLALTGQPFGFMSMLGVIALVGIVVNNAIVLLEVVEQRRSEGASVDDALSDAVRLRLRPIGLTTLTTVAGMVPLALSGSALWPPLASAMISGLLASTALTLLAVPALYKLLFTERTWTWRPWRPALAVATALFVALPARGAELGLDEVLALVATAPDVRAAQADAQAEASFATARWLDVTTPSVGAQADFRRRDQEVALDTPIGPFVQQPLSVGTVGVRARQPLVDPAGWAGARAGSWGARAARHGAEHAEAAVAQEVVGLYLDLAVAQTRLEAADAMVVALGSAADRAEDFAAEGLALESDALRAAVALSDAEQQARAARTQVDLLGRLLAARLGLDELVSVRFEASVDAQAPSRADDAALAAREQAGRVERIARASRLLPRVDLDVGWQATDNRTLVKGAWMDGGVVASWSLGAGRLAELQGSAQRGAALTAQQDALERAITWQQEAARQQLVLATADLDARQRSVVQAESAARVLRDRYDEQLAPLTDLLAAEAALAGQRVAVRQAEADVLRARSAVAFSRAVQR
jgi:multidrug efflux pump subunit AcrB/outer membrane protein TolC